MAFSLQFSSLLEYALVNYSGLNEERRKRLAAEKKERKQQERNVYLYPPTTLQKNGPAANNNAVVISHTSVFSSPRFFSPLNHITDICLTV